MHGDLRELSTVAEVLRALGDRKADVVLSDLMPPLIGIKRDDHLASADMCLLATEIMEKTLALGGWFIVKIYYGGEKQRFQAYLKTRFTTVRSARPWASKNEFREMFFVCHDFIGRPSIAEEVQTRGSFNWKEGLQDRFRDGKPWWQWEVEQQAKMAKKDKDDS